MNLFSTSILTSRVINTTKLLLTQYRTIANIYDNPCEHQTQIFKSIIGHWFYVKPNPKKEQELLEKCSTFLGLHELAMELLNMEYGFNRLDLKSQVALENQILKILEEQEILC